MKLPFNSPRTEFVIKRMLREDAGGLDGVQLRARQRPVRGARLSRRQAGCL